MKNIVFAIGRNRFYPYICIILVTLAFLYTQPFKELNWRYAASYFGAVTGLICVILLAKGKNSGNIFGMMAVFGESSANFLGGNIGAALPSIYYFGTHVFGLLNWRRHQNAENRVVTRNLKEKHFFWTLVFFVVAALLNIFLTGILNVDNDPYQLTANNFIFALGVVAQFLLVQRFSFNWYLWIILNVLVIGLNIYTHNPVIATQYAIYLFNSTYGLMEWRREENKDRRQNDI